MYWVSCMIQDKEGSRPWLCAAGTACPTFDEAMNTAKRYTEIYRCLSVWIEKAINGSMEVCYHKCFLNALGQWRCGEYRGKENMTDGKLPFCDGTAGNQGTFE